MALPSALTTYDTSACMGESTGNTRSHIKNGSQSGVPFSAPSSAEVCNRNVSNVPMRIARIYVAASKMNRTMIGYDACMHACHLLANSFVTVLDNGRHDIV